MKRYSQNRPCPKCGGYASTSHEFDLMVRRCARCGYRWDEQPLDAPEDPKPRFTLLELIKGKLK